MAEDEHKFDIAKEEQRKLLALLDDGHRELTDG